MRWYTRTDEDGATWVSFDKVFWIRAYEWELRPKGPNASNTLPPAPRARHTNRCWDE